MGPTKKKNLKNVVISTDVISIEEKKDLRPLSEYLDIKYRLVRTERFDRYMKEMGLNIIARKVGLKIVPTHMILTYKNDFYTLLTTSVFLKLEVKFKLGEEFDFKTPDGRSCKVTFEFDPPNRLVEYQRGAILNIIVREFNPDIVIMSLRLETIECVMIYVNSISMKNSIAPVHASRGVSEKASSIPFFRKKSKLCELSKITLQSDRAREIMDSKGQILKSEDKIKAKQKDNIADKSKSKL